MHTLCAFMRLPFCDFLRPSVAGAEAKALEQEIGMSDLGKVRLWLESQLMERQGEEAARLLEIAAREVEAVSITTPAKCSFQFYLLAGLRHIHLHRGARPL